MDVLSQTFLYDRIVAGIDVHPSMDELMEFEKLSKQINPTSDFSFRGCQPCVNEMIRFVFENKTKLDGIQKNNRNKAKSE